MKIDYLNDSDEHDVIRHSSIDQYNNFLAVLKGGKAVPVRFDSLDWINCEGIKTHPIIISDGSDIGFNFPIGRYTYFTDTYLIMDRKEVTIGKLPHWYGEGWFEKAVDKDVFTNFDDSSLGERNRVDLRIGLDFVASDEILEPSDDL